MKYFFTSVVVISFISIHYFAQISAERTVTSYSIKHTLTISGKLYYTQVSRGGIQRDERNLPLIPLQKFTLYVVRFISADSTPIVVKSFTTNKKGEFSVSLPTGKYGFITLEEIKSGLSKGQSLPKSSQTNTNNVANSSVWESSMACPIELKANSIKNLEIINHRSSFCMNCQ